MKFSAIIAAVVIGVSSVMALPGKSPLCDVAKAAGAISNKMKPNMALPADAYKISFQMAGAEFRGILVYVTDDAQPTTAAGAPMAMGQFTIPAKMQNNGATCAGSEFPESSITHTNIAAENYPGQQTFEYTVSPKAKGNLNLNVVVVVVPPKGGKMNQVYQNTPMYGGVTSAVANVATCPPGAVVTTTATTTITNMKTVTITTTQTTTSVQTQVHIRKCTRKVTGTPVATPIGTAVVNVAGQVTNPPVWQTTPAAAYGYGQQAATTAAAYKNSYAAPPAYAPPAPAVVSSAAAAPGSSYSYGKSSGASFADIDDIEAELESASLNALLHAPAPAVEDEDDEEDSE
ncbi:hypothetical protein BC829DRAFT_382746 [Chytridium lagenaria]|nr:hypothetical protein BC829DRAFT_382746 [Chytridium lagenaria]